jgi:hypothetical protein
MERPLTRCVRRCIILNSCCSQAMVSAAAYDSRIYMLVLLLTDGVAAHTVGLALRHHHVTTEHDTKKVTVSAAGMLCDSRISMLVVLATQGSACACASVKGGEQPPQLCMMSTALSCAYC